MAIPLRGYSTDRELSASARARVYAGRRLHDDLAIVAKVVDVHDRALEARVEHEFELLSRLELPRVVRPIALERSGEQLVLLLERVEGRTLAEYTQGRALPAAEVARLGADIARTLAEIHACSIIHRDIKPSNLLLEAATGEVHIADFGISVLVESEHRYLYDSRLLEGTLPYISPEQTGRTKRATDARSDLYSLGVTLYELAVGQLPFDKSSALELIHAHLALAPPNPRSLQAKLPVALAELILRLLAKAPEQRYQTAEGLCADLELMARGFAAGSSMANFELGGQDYSRSLSMPSRLYGRERELAELQEGLDALLASSRPSVVALAGGPGLGKSALLASFDETLLGHAGRLARGKFDQHGRSRPYEAFAQALGPVLERYLTLPEAKLREASEQLAEGLGGLAGVIVELIPQLSILLPEHAAVPALGLEQSRNRLALAFVRLCAVLTRGGPLVLMLDDAQWADLGSLELLQALATDERVGDLLLVVAYRDAEVDELHPLGMALAQLETLVEVRHIVLEALSAAQLREMLADVLRRPPEAVEALAQLCARKTDNNPFFVLQFLGYLVDRGLLRASPGGWTWELEAIAGAGIPDGVLGVLTAKLGSLSPAQQAVLHHAACQGTQFELELIAEAMQRTPGELVGELYALEAAGIVDLCTTGYAFVHDRVREAALLELDEGARARVHAALGAALVRRHGLDAEGEHAAQLGDEIYLVVDQLNAGVGSEEDSSRPRAGLLLELNHRAGARALTMAAWDRARDYLERACEGAQGAKASQRIEIEHGLAQALAMLGDEREAVALYEGLLARELPSVVRAEVIGRRADILTASGQVDAAIELALAGLATLGVSLPRKPSLPRVIVAVLRGWSGAGSTTREQLLALPQLQDDGDRALIYAYAAVVRASFIIEPGLFALGVTELARMAVQRGYDPIVPLTLVQLGVAGCGLGKVGEATRLCRDAIAVAVQRSPGAVLTTRTKMYAYALVDPVARPWAEVSEQILPLHEEALELGDKWSAGIIAAFGLSFSLESGLHLRELLELHARFVRADESFGLLEMGVVASFVHRCAATLHASSAQPGPGFLRAEQLPREGINPVTSYSCKSTETLGCVLLGDFERAAQLCDEIDGDYEQVMAGSWVLARHAAYSSVVAAERGAAASGGARRAFIARVRKNLAVARKWAKGCTTNYGPYADLIEAELAGLKGQLDRASALFERARSGALAGGPRVVAALAMERLAKLMARHGREATAMGLRALVIDEYRRWGARAVVERLAGPAHSEAARMDRATTDSRQRVTSVMTTGTAVIDADAMFSMLQAVNEELELSKVVERVLQRSVETAGADHGALLLEHEGSVSVVATASPQGAREQLARAVPVAEASALVPVGAVNLILRAGGSLVIDDARLDARFADDPYIQASGLRSLFVLAIETKRRRVGALVLENRQSSQGFTRERVDTLQLLAAQAATALDHAALYEAQRRSEARWRSLVDDAPDLITMMDAEGRLEFANRARPYGHASNALMGAGLERLLDAEQGARWSSALAAVLREHQAEEIELEIEESTDAGGAGRRRWYLIHLAPIVDDGQLRKLIAISKDISARRAAEAEAARLEGRVRQQQRLEALGTLAAGLAHEIKNPLHGINSFAELLDGAAEEPELVREFAGDILTETQRVSTLVRNLLSFSRQDEGQAEPLEEVAIHELVDATRVLVRSILQRDRVRLELDLEQDLPPLRCRSQQLQQIIINLITNARDAFAEAPEREDKWIRVSAGRATLTRDEAVIPALRLSVRDNGTGMPEAVLAKIFDPFFTTKARDEGTGLGLALCHRIANEHGGELWASSEVGVGTVFHLDLPLVGSELSGA